MRKSLGSLALLGLAAFGSAQTALYDVTSAAGLTYFPNNPESARGSDIFSVIAPPTNTQYLIQQLKFTAIFKAAGTYAVSARVRLYSGANASATGTTAVFSNLVRDLTLTATTTATGLSGSTYTATLATPFLLPTSSAYGVQIELKNGTVYDSNLVLGYKNTAPVAGVGDNGFYFDTNNDSIVTGGERINGTGFTNGNLSFSILGTAQPVPEPASMVALGLGAAAMLRRRKKA